MEKNPKVKFSYDLNEQDPVIQPQASLTSKTLKININRVKTLLSNKRVPPLRY